MVQITKEQIIGENRLSRQDKINLFEGLLLSTNRAGMDKVLDFIKRSDFYTAPASSNHHSSYEGGLLDHVLLVYSLAMDYANTMKAVDPNLALVLKDENIIISSLLHDFCKLYIYKPTQKWKKDEYNQWVAYNGYNIEDMFPVGHGEKSIIMLQGIGLDLEPCEMIAIRHHMGFWGGETNREATATQLRGMKMCPLVILLQMADFSSSLIFEIDP